MEKIIVKQGDVFAFETDTVWGLGCLPDDDLAVEKIYEIKKRDKKKPLILMSHDKSYLEKYILGVSDYSKLLMQKYFPGALTLIFKCSPLCPTAIRAGLDTVGIRVPNSKNFEYLTTQLSGCTLATTSLNISNEPPILSYEDAVKYFGDVVKVIKPKYPSNVAKVASTVALCTEDKVKILRQGSIKIN